MSFAAAQLKLHVKPLPIDSWLKFLGTTQGRDKTYRLVQYFGRFIAFYLSQLSPEADYVKRIQRLSVGVGLARKLFRVGKPLDNLQVILKSSAIEDELERSLTVSKALGFGGWLALDMFQWLNSVKVVELSPEWLGFVNKNAPRLWLFGLLSSLSLNLYKIHRLHPQSLKSRDEMKSLLVSGTKDAATCQAAKDALQDLVDVVIPLSLTGTIDVSPGVVGAAGTFTSCLAISSLLK